jgi:hypothetical protein
MVLTDHGATLTHLTLAACDIKDADAAPEDEENFGNNGNWGHQNGGNWTAGQRASHGAFDRALSACMNLIHLSIEPGSYPVFAPSLLFRPYEKLESLEFNMRNAGGYDYSAWHTLLGLVPILQEEKRKLKSMWFDRIIFCSANAIP